MKIKVSPLCSLPGEVAGAGTSGKCPQDVLLRVNFNVCTARATSIRNLQSVLIQMGMWLEINFHGRPNSTNDIPFLVARLGRLPEAAGWTACHPLFDSLRTLIMMQTLPF